MEFSAVNTIWVLVGAALVFFMQAGFAMVETGLTRAKNTGNIIMKNLMDFCIGTPCFFLVGFGLMFGGDGSFVGGFSGIASEANYGTSMLPSGVPFNAFLIFQTVFCATAATIVSGAMAERTKFIANVSIHLSLVCSFTLSQGIGSGEEDGFQNLDSMILQVLQLSIWSVESLHSSEH